MTEVVKLEPQPVAAREFHELRPQQMIQAASQIATALAPIIEQQKLYKLIGGGKHVMVEGWTTMGAMLGILPRERDVKLNDDGDYEAYVELISLKTGHIVGGASAICGKSEPTWASRPHNARRSMAITRATGKAFRLGYSWIIKLAGYDATPAEELDHVTETRGTVASSSAQERDNNAGTRSSFNCRHKQDIEWLKQQLPLEPEATLKQIALKLHGRQFEDLQKVLDEEPRQ